MNEIKYPYLNEHKTMHKVIIRNMSHLIKNIKKTNDLKERLYIIISKWFLEHILYHDIMIKHWKENNDNAVQNLENKIELFILVHVRQPIFYPIMNI